MKQELSGSIHVKSNVKGNLTVCKAVTEDKIKIIIILLILFCSSVILGFLTSSWIVAVFGLVLDAASFILGFKARKCKTKII